MRERAREKWIDSLCWQIEFYRRRGRVRRLDPEFEWQAYERSPGRRFPVLGNLAKRILHRLKLRDSAPLSIDWLRRHSEALWATRAMLDDELSRLLFDSTLTVRLSDYRQFYFPRIDFDDLIEILAERPFDTAGFPHEYLGVPLRSFEIRLGGRPQAKAINVVTRLIQLQLVNSYRQYLIRRHDRDISPRPGEVVYDCGACIGEISIIFAGLVAPAGAVHLFDPMPLHIRFCQMQASLNPALEAKIVPNTCAVGNRTHDAAQALQESSRIEPGAISTDQFACTTLDDYTARQTDGVDFIKMDIEGAEIDALSGSSRVIAEFRPRLAISAYHKPEHLWEIPQLLRKLNPYYTLTFGHHTPISWESVFYAEDASRAPAGTSR